MKKLTVIEEVVMLAVYQLKENAYSVTIHQKIMKMTGKDMIVGTLFNTLKQLHRKGYLEKTRAEPVQGKGRKKIMLYQISKEGFQALEQTRAMHIKIWRYVPQVLK
jgi:PadR family transcriptional regulator PadR